MLTGSPLAGFRVLDFTHAAAGPFATMLLADNGAEAATRGQKVARLGRGHAKSCVSGSFEAIER